MILSARPCALTLLNGPIFGTPEGVIKPSETPSMGVIDQALVPFVGVHKVTWTPIDKVTWTPIETLWTPINSCKKKVGDSSRYTCVSN
jgi:hypothetical protein